MIPTLPKSSRHSHSPQLRQSFLSLALLPFVLFTCLPQSQDHASTRTVTPTDSTTPHEVSITKLFDPIYPPLAKQTRQFGDVQLQLTIRPDGTVESAEVLSGPPLLRDAALTSAQKSTFTCTNCADGPTFYLLTYTFQVTFPTKNCAPSPTFQNISYPQVTHTANHITIVDQAPEICDPVATITYNKVRSLKCLYLWRCARSRPIGVE